MNRLLKILSLPILVAGVAAAAIYYASAGGAMPWDAPLPKVEGGGTRPKYAVYRVGDELTRKVNGHVRGKEFKALEELAKKIKSENLVFRNGESQLPFFYNAIQTVLREQEKYGGVDVVDALFDKWDELVPNSLTRRVAEAYFRVNSAWIARGSGLADTVRDANWDTFHRELERAKKVLDEADTIKDDFDPHVLAAKIKVGVGLSSPREKMDAVVTTAIEKCPGYEPVFTNMAEYLLPRWHGEQGDLRKYGDDLLKRLPAPNNDIIYARVVNTVVPYEGVSALKEVFPYIKVQRAFETLIKAYPESIQNRTLYCRSACWLQDRITAEYMFKSLGDQYDHPDYLNLWSNRGKLEAYRKWALADGAHPDVKSPLFDAVAKANAKAVAKAVKDGADVNAKDATGRYALSCALQKGEHEIALLLIKLGADPLATDSNGIKLAHYAVHSDDAEVVELMLKKGLPLNGPLEEGGFTLLHSAAGSDSRAVVELLMKQPGINPDIKTSKGVGPLHIAAESNNVEIIQMLIKGGATVDLLDGIKITPLHQATFTGSAEAVTLLLKHGADPTRASQSGITPLMTAEREHKSEVVKLLKAALKDRPATR